MLQTIGDLRAFLQEHDWSPEDLAARVPVSNMTWRRLLAKPNRSLLPAKYQGLLAKQFSPPAESFGFPVSPEDVVITGMALKPHQVVQKLSDAGADVVDRASLLTKVKEKQGLALLPTDLISRLRDLLTALPTATRNAKLLILGGLVYFLNPLDLIADSAVAVGFIDDVGVLSLISQHLRDRKSKK